MWKKKQGSVGGMKKEKKVSVGKSGCIGIILYFKINSPIN
jgi:hypothetical protein